MINVSVILCSLAGLFGLFVLIKWFCILRPDVNTNAQNAIPVMITTVAWLSAAVTFYQTETFNSPIDAQRFFMILGWAWLIYRIKFYRELSQRQQKTINHLKEKYRENI